MRSRTDKSVCLCVYVRGCVWVWMCVCVCVREAKRETVGEAEGEYSHLLDHSPSPRAARPGFPIAHPKRPHGVTVAALLAP